MESISSRFDIQELSGENALNDGNDIGKIIIFITHLWLFITIMK